MGETVVKKRRKSQVERKATKKRVRDRTGSNLSVFSFIHF